MTAERIAGFGQRVKRTRIAMQMSQQSLGEYCGKSPTAAQTACSDWERKDKLPREPEVRAKLMDAIEKHEAEASVGENLGGAAAANLEQTLKSVLAQLKAVAGSMPVEKVTIAFTINP